MIPEYRQSALRRGVRWPIRLRLLLLIPGSHPWNRRVRNWTALMEGHASYEAETTDPMTPTDRARAVDAMARAMRDSFFPEHAPIQIPKCHRL